MSVSQETVPAQPPRNAAPRRYRVLWPDCGPQRELATAQARAQEIADREGQPIPIRDEVAGCWLQPVQPRQHLCFNKQCRAALTPAEHPASYRTGRCRHCTPTAEGS